MEQPVPDWINAEFLTECLRKEEGKGAVVVTGFHVSPAVPPGHNFNSCVFRVKMEFRDQDEGVLQQVSLIVKSDVIVGESDGMYHDLMLKESFFYNQFLPVAMKLTELSVAPKRYISPRPYTFVLEDLNEQGFSTLDRREWLGPELCHLYAISLARLHALSVAVFHRHPDLLLTIGEEGVYLHDSISSKPYKNLIKCGFKHLAKETEKIKRFKRYGKLIRDTSEVLWDLLIEVHKPSEHLNTLNHGDSWLLNLMFRHVNDGVVREIKLLDFQQVRYVSPANDLVFFLWSSACDEVRSGRLQDFYQVYLDTINSELELLDCSERLTYAQLKSAVDRCAPIALFMMAVHQPVHEHPVDFDMAPFLNTDSLHNNPYDVYYTEDYCRNRLPKLLEQLEAADVFKCLETFTDSTHLSCHYQR